MRRSLIVGNWKMNTSLADATIIATSVKTAAEDLDGIEIVLCPPFVWLTSLSEIIENSSGNLSLGAQNMWFTDKGPITGEISPVMLKDLVKFVILGHSERRLNFGESGALINDKIQAAFRHGITPIICVGELKKMPQEKRGRGRPSSVDVKSDILHQLEEALNGINHDDAEKMVICYEPVWAISKGTVESRNPASGAYAASVISKLREVVAKKYRQALSERVRILYGGSVDEKNIKEYIYQPEIDGVLVGGASLNAKGFIAICREALGE